MRRQLTARAAALLLGATLVATVLPAFTGIATAADGTALPVGPPDATVNLATRDGVRLVDGTWRFRDVSIVEVDHRSPGPDRKPSGPPNRTHDILPRAGAREFDDSGWEVLDAATLEERRSTGKLCFAWYRISVTVPRAVGDFDPTGSTLVFETVVDDYAEVWVDGQLPRTLGQSGGSLVAGWNAPNRVILGRDVKPGQRFQVAIFAMNGPVSDAPDNYIWMRSATLGFHREPHAVTPEPVPVFVEGKHEGLGRVLPAEPLVERIATGFRFTEGPLWLPEGALLFSDPNTNIIWRWTPAGELSVFRHPSGYDGADVAEYRQPGSNGLTLDGAGRLATCEHGNRRVTRTERNGTITVLADRYQGKRLNSPNDLVYRSDGALYFTDPPFGLPGFHDDPRREQPHFGVYRVKDGVVDLVSTDFTGPNGLAFSPDERFLYVANWDEKKKVVLRYPVLEDGRLGRGESFFDLTRAPGDEALDGLKVDELGNVYLSGPGGLWIISPEGKALGTVVLPELPANFTFGDADGRTLYMTARTGVYRMRLGVAGRAPGMAMARHGMSQ